VPDYGVRLERSGKVAIVTLDRPLRRNAMDEHMWGCFEEATAALERDLPRAVVITGAGGKAFCAGFDVNPENPQVSRLAHAMTTGDARPARELVVRIRSAVDRLVGLGVPVIAAISGIAYGGGAEMACRCDLRVMDQDAVICFSEVRLGLMPDHGGVVGLVRLVGASRACDLICTARTVGAEEAYALGIANRISAPGKALEESLELARAIAANGPRAVRSALAVIRRAGELPAREALDLETDTAARLIACGECIEGIAAFLERRTPDFRDPGEGPS